MDLNSWQFTIYFVMLRKDYWFHYSNPAASEVIHDIKTKEIQPGKKMAKRDRNKVSFCCCFKFLVSMQSRRSKWYMHCRKRTFGLRRRNSTEKA